MAINVETLAAAMSYTNISIAGGGAIKGKNCVISSITNISGGQRVTFQWTLDNGTVQTAAMDVLNGVKGDTGLGIHSVAINSNSHLIITYDDGTTEDAGEIQGGGGAVIDDTAPTTNKVYSSEKVEELIGDMPSDLPSYYQTEYDATKASVESHSTNDSFNIIWMTDLHFVAKGSGYNESQLHEPLFRTIKAAKKFSGEVPIDMFGLGGDYEQFPTGYTKEDGISNIAELNATFDEIGTPFFPIAGNHEHSYSGVTGAIGLTADEVYQYLLKKWVGRNNVKKVSINTFYRIDDVNGVCHVFISSFSEWGTRQAITSDFSAIVTANTNNYPYIIYNHFGSTQSGMSTDVQYCIDYIKTTLGKTIIAWISGHWHADGVYVYNNTLVISLLNSSFLGDGTGQDGQTYSKTQNTYTESAFSVLTIVPTTGKLFITRFGVGVDMECNYNNISGAVGRIGYLPVSDYEVTQTLSGGVASSNSATEVSSGATYSTTLSVPDSHFTFGTVTVTMGGTDITSTAYNSSTHVISIASVSGDIAITATATNDYYWTLSGATITQFNGGKRANYTQTQNDIDVETTNVDTGVRVSNTPKASTQSGNITFYLKADEVTWTSADNDKPLFVFKVYWRDANDTQIAHKDFSYHADWGTKNYKLLEDGFTTTVNNLDLSTVASFEWEVRLISGTTVEQLPATISVKNFHIAIQS